MAINFTRLFTAIGKILGSLNSANTYRGTTLPARTAILDAQYVSPNQELIEGLYTEQESAQGNLDGWVDYLQGLAVDTLIKEVNLDRPMVGSSTTEALTRVAQGLRDAGETVAQSPATLAQVSSLTVGNGILSFTAGVNLSSLFLADSYVIRCISDQTTGATAFSEAFSVQGKANVDPLDYRWPQGSDVDSVILATDSANDTLIPADPSTWTLTGTRTTGPANPRAGSTGSSTLTGVATAIQTATGALAPGSYAWTVFLKGSGSNTAASTAVVSIVNSSGATVATLATFDAVANTSWTQLSGTWNFTTVPPITPSAQYFFKIVLAGGPTVVVDVAFPGMQQLIPMYPGGPCMLIWSGSTAFGLADLWTASVTRGGSETGSLYRGLERLFSISTLAPQVQIPVNELPALPTYADSLVT